MMRMIFDIIFDIADGAFTALPDFHWSVDTPIIDGALKAIHLAGYLLPMNAIAAIATIIFFTISFRIVVSLLRTIWEVLPLV